MQRDALVDVHVQHLYIPSGHTEGLKRLARRINSETPVRITVHCNLVWVDALREAKKKSFSASALLKVFVFNTINYISWSCQFR